jgi:hypothetical protein
MPLTPKFVQKYGTPPGSIIPGLTLLSRDVDLGELEARYTRGLVIREKGYTDASRKWGGMVTSHRFAILSRNFIDADKLGHETNWGLCILPRDSRFRVLDIYCRKGKTQITLLHLQDQSELPQDIMETIDKKGVAYARKRFDECLAVPPVPELATEEWLKRCQFPLGMTDEGKFFPLTDG